MLFLHHLKHRVPFEELCLNKNNKNLFHKVNKGKTSIIIDPVVYMKAFLKLENWNR